MQDNLSEMLSRFDGELRLGYLKNAADAWLYFLPWLADPDAAYPETKRERRLSSYRATDLPEEMRANYASAFLSRSIIVSEKPELVNALMERACNLQCAHCLLPSHASSRRESQNAGLDSVLENLVMQLSGTSLLSSPMFLHEGRILQPWHVDFLARLKIAYPRVRVGLIDNGTYTRLLPEFRRSGLNLDWLDISCDGTIDVHNAQRDPSRSSRVSPYDAMMRGLVSAREVTGASSDGGRVSALMTLTSLNYDQTIMVAQDLFRPNPIRPRNPLIDELHVTTMSPRQAPNYNIEISQEHLYQALIDVYGLQRAGLPVFLRIYNNKHFSYLAGAVGKETMRAALRQAKAHRHGMIELDVGGVRVHYQPSSIWPAEGIFVDADGCQRVAYAQAYTLDGLARNAQLSHYTVSPLNRASSLLQAHQDNAEQWRRHFMRGYLQEEAAIARSILH